MKFFKVVSIIFILATLVLTGCESVWNIPYIDVNEIMKESAKPANIYETNETITLDLNYDESRISDQDLIIYQLLDNLKLDVNVKKYNDVMKLEGTLQLDKGEIPFKMSTTEDQTVIWIDNAKKPILLRKDVMEETGIMPYEFTGLYQEENKDVYNDMVEFIVDNLPNPSQIDTGVYKPIEINNETRYLAEISAKVDTKELPELAIKLLKNIKEDERLKDLIAPIIKAQYGDMVPEDQMDEFVEATYFQLMPEIDNAIAAIDEIVEAGQWPFGEESYLETKLYVDNNLNIRKGDTNIHFVTPEMLVDSTEGLLGLDATISYERFNIENEDLVVTPIDVTGLEVIDENSSDEEFMNSLNEDGVFYDIIVNDFLGAYQY